MSEKLSMSFGGEKTPEPFDRLRDGVMYQNMRARVGMGPDLTLANSLAGMDEIRMLGDLEKQLKAANEKVDKLVKLIDPDNLAKAVEHNASWFSGGDAEELVNVSVSNIVRATKSLEVAQDELRTIESRIIETKQSLYVKVYEELKDAGSEADAILLTAFDDLGENIPKSLKSEIVAAKARKVNDPNATEFDKLFYSGKSMEALAVLAKSNNETPAVAGFNDDEIFKIYQETSKVQFGGGVRERRDAIKYRMKENSLGAHKLREGYVPLVLPGIDPYDETTPTAIVKEKADGSLSIYFVNQQGDIQGKEHLATPGNAATVEAKNDEIQENFAKAFGKIPSFNRLGNAGRLLQSKFVPLQKLFVSGSSGKKTKGFVDLAKGYARSLQESNDLSILRSTLPQVKKDLSLLKALPSGYKGKFEAQIDQMERALSQMAELTAYGGMLDHFCEQVLNPAFSEDDLMSWWIKEGITIAIALGTAVTAIVLTVSTGGVGGLALGALVGTIGGMAGAQVGHVVSESFGEERYGKGFSNKSMLGQYLAKEKMIDPATGKLKEIGGVDLVKEYGQQFVVGFITTFALLGLGQLAGRALSRFAKVNAATKGFKGDLASLINKIPKLQAQHVDLLSKRGLSHLTKRLGEEYVQEIGEETVQRAAERCGVLSGFAASLYFALSPGKMKNMVGKHNVSADGVVVTDTGVVSNFSFDVNEAASVTGKIEQGLNKQGFVVTRNADGSISCEKTVTLKDGTVITNKLVFSPTSESLEMRDLMGSGGSVRGKSELAELYGVSKVADNKYEFDKFSPEGKVDLGKYLKRQGFVVVENDDGSLTATKGKDTVELRVKGADPDAGKSVSFEAARPQIDALVGSLEAIAATDPVVREQLARLRAESRALMGDIAAAAESGRPISESEAGGLRVRIGKITANFAVLLHAANANAADEWGVTDTWGLIAKVGIFSLAVLGGYAVFPTGMKMLDRIGLNYPSKFVLGKLQDITARLQARPGTAPGDVAVQSAGRALDAKLKKLINGAKSIEAELDDGSYDLLPFALVVRNITKTGNRMLAILDEATAAAAAGRPYAFPAEFADLKTKLDKHVADFEKSLKQKGKIGTVAGIKVFAYVTALLTAMHVWAWFSESKPAAGKSGGGAPAPAPAAPGRIEVKPAPAPAPETGAREEEVDDGATDERRAAPAPVTKTPQRESTEPTQPAPASKDETSTVNPSAPKIKIIDVVEE